MMVSRDSVSFRNVEPVEAEHLIRKDEVRVLDVRTFKEYEELGHIPGALLLPVDLIASAPAALPEDGKPLLVYCEHGVRSQYAAQVLAQAGIENVLNLIGGMSCWSGPREHGPAAPSAISGPSSWLLQNTDLLSQGGQALDVACGSGRHTLLLASVGFSVRAVDANAEKIEKIRVIAERLGLQVETEQVDLESGETDLGEDLYELVLGVHYLYRPLFPSLVRTLKPGGLLLYETFTVHQANRGKPTNPDYLLEPGELPKLAAPLEVLRQREGEYEGRMVASVAARKPAASD